MKCPKCGQPIGFEATQHDACGWNVPTKGAPSKPGRPFIHCAHEDCPDCAIVWLKGANLCRKHYERKVSEAAADFCSSLNLTTRADMRKYCRERIPRIGRIIEPPPVSETPQLTGDESAPYDDGYEHTATGE